MGKLENKIFKVILIASVVSSILSIAGNIAFQFDFSINYKWFVLLIITAVTYHKFFNRSSRKFKLYYFVYVIVVMIPFGWIDSGGSLNNSISYVFVLLITISFLFDKKYRVPLSFSLIAITLSLVLLEYFFPSYIRVHSDSSQILDRVFQTGLTLSLAYGLLQSFSQAYYQEGRALSILASKDPLTGLYNRRYFEEIFNSIINKVLHQEAYLLIIDIDYFKQVNDQLGHQKGDEVLLTISNLLKERYQSENISRWGGDEFVIIFSGDKSELVEKTHKLLDQVNQLEKDYHIPLSLSCGATAIDENLSKDEIFKKADEKLYFSKEKGRNQLNI